MDSEVFPRCKVRRSAQQIQQLATEFHCGDQTVGQFANQHGVAVSTVQRWLRTQRPPGAPRLVEVQREPEPGSGRVGIMSAYTNQKSALKDADFAGAYALISVNGNRAGEDYS